MKTASESIYFIAISPVNPLQNRIDEIKSNIYQKYGSKGSFRSPAHITLQMPFRKKLNKLEGLQRSLKLFAEQVNPFEINLKDFGCFEPRVIYIKVLENNLLIELQKQLQLILRSHQIFSSTYKDQVFNPHITVAFRDLKKQQFYQIWEEFKLKEFEGSFKAEGINLFKHNGEKWETIHFFPFKSA